MDLNRENGLEAARVPRSLPRGRSHLPREVVLLSQRARLIEATVEVVGSKGYPASTVGDIIGAAGVSRSTFYEQFRDKEECFIVAYEEGARSNLDHVVAAVRDKPGGMERLQTGVRAFLERLADAPAYARISTLEVLAAGSGAATSRELVHERYAALLRKWHAEMRAEQPLVPEIPVEVFTCAVGGVSDLVAGHVRKDMTQALPRLAPVIVTFLLNVAAAPAGRELAAALSRSRARRSA
jgi:AcrR family transcriptional regulator